MDYRYNIYDLMRNWFDFCFENPEKIKPNHSALYFFSLSHCNRLGWKEKFGMPTTMTMEAIGIKSYSVYKKTFDDLVDFGFFEVIEYSKNQYSSNIIALKENYKASLKAHDKALDNASVKHMTKQVQSTFESIDKSTIQSNESIIIPIHNNTNTQINQLTNTQKEKIKKEKPKIETLQIINPFVDELFVEHWEKWKNYKIKEKNFKWKSDISEGVSIKKLFKDSNGNLNLAILMIENAIANGYSGIFPIKNQILNNQNGKPKTTNASEQLDEFKRNLAAKYATENQNQTPDFEDGGYAEDVDN